MQKIFAKRLCIYMLIAMLVTVAGLFLFQSIIANWSNLSNSEDRLLTAREKLIDNEEEIAQLTENLGQSSLAKARAFAYIISLDPDFIKSKDNLLKICDLLMVDEVHVTDEQGILRYGTVDNFIGFNFADGDQTKPFLDIIKNPDLELIQEPQPNAVAGTLFQYIGVSRIDKPGIVQVGVRPEVLEEMLNNTTIDKLFSGLTYGDTGYLFAIDTATQNILAEKNSSLIGQNAFENGYPKDILSGGNGRATIGNIKGHYVAEVFNDMIIGTMMPDTEYYENRRNQTTIFTICIIIIFVTLIILINRLVNRKIVRGIQSISSDLQKIKNGDLNTTVSETGNPEFILLSDNINSMVSSIRENMQKNESLLYKQKEDMEHNLSLIQNVKDTCQNIDQISQDTLRISQEIQAGSKEQETALETLHSTMDVLNSQLRESADVSSNISDSTNESVRNMLKARDNMEQLSTSITEISDMSMKIEKIISEIDAIASQTNMLSLNASIEAARAGEAGHSFAVVAKQVGELAIRSTQAASETNKLIMNSIKAVTKGKSISDEAIKEFLSVVSEIENVGQEVVKISEMTDRQVQSIKEAVDGLEKISEVAQKNSLVSNNSEVTSESLAAEAGKLRELVKE